MGITHLHHAFLVGNVERFPTSGEVGGPGGRNSSLLPVLLSLSAAYNVDTTPTVAHTTWVIDRESLENDHIPVVGEGWPYDEGREMCEREREKGQNRARPASQFRLDGPQQFANDTNIAANRTCPVRLRDAGER